MYAQTNEIVVQFLGHSLGQGGHKHTLVAFLAQCYLFYEVVNLVERRTHADKRVEQAGRSDKLFDHYAFAALQLVVGRSGAYIHQLRRECLEFLEFQRTVVERCRKPEAVFHQILLAREVAYMARICGTVTWLSSIMVRKSLGK